MQIRYRHGFVSAVKDRDEPDAIMVRAMDIDSIAWLMEKAFVDAEVSTPLYTPAGHYQYRITVPIAIWIAMAAAAAADVDYDDLGSAIVATGMAEAEAYANEGDEA